MATHFYGIQNPGHAQAEPDVSDELLVMPDPDALCRATACLGSCRSTAVATSGSGDQRIGRPADRATSGSGGLFLPVRFLQLRQMTKGSRHTVGSFPDILYRG